MRWLAAALCAFALHACGGCRGEVPILTWHAVAQGSGSYDVAPPAFARQLDAIRAAGFHTVSLHEVLAHQDSGAPLPKKPVVLTFDDGTADGFTTVLPALRARGMKATFFLVPAWLGSDEAHRHVEVEEGVARPCLTVQEARALHAAGMELGAHGLAHLRLAGLSEESAREQIGGARSLLAQLLGIPIDLFAYPYNSVRRPHRALVREAGYRAAVAGVDHGSSDRFSLYRAPVARSTTPEELVATLSAWH
ncbi:MAG TPA: polysaccharide deacetylase family protein [Myxococcales bacterium]|nr:polysaccharide deacetylase family protein [Myxococcales bacterium]